MNRCCLLLDVGGTFIKVGASASDGCILPDVRMSIPICSEGSREEITAPLAEAVRLGVHLIRDKGLVLAGVGVCIPGPFDYENGISLMKHKFQSVYGMSIRDLLRSFPEIGNNVPVKFIHDVNAVLLGEMYYGNAMEYGNAAVITLGTGLGFTYSVDRRIMTNGLGSPLRPIYYRPYLDGILEDYASKRGFIRVYNEISGREYDPYLSVAGIGELASCGDMDALNTFSRIGEIIADAVRGLVSELNIGCLLFGGQISNSFRFMEKSLVSGLSDIHGLSVISPVRHIETAAFYGLITVLFSSCSQ